MALIDCFVAAIRDQESGGNYGAYNPGSGAAGAYQFEPGTWRFAVQLAGLGTWAGTSANNAPPWVQDAAAKALMQSYYAQFGSFFSVAEAWYGGPGAVGHPEWGGGPGYPNVGQYATEVTNKMNAICAGGGEGPVSTAPPGAPPVAVDLSGVNAAWEYSRSVWNDGYQAKVGSFYNVGNW